MLVLSNVFHHQAAHPTKLRTPPKPMQFLVQLLYNYTVKFDKVPKLDRLDSFTRSSIVTLHMTFAARWQCPLTWWSSFSHHLLLNHLISLCT
jgi:hypothetical protein